jgi:hypothetical protein
MAKVSVAARTLICFSPGIGSADILPGWARLQWWIAATFAERRLNLNDRAAIAPVSGLVGATRLPIGWIPRHLRFRKIWIGNTHGGEARCSGVALRHRAIAAVDGVASAPVPLLQAYRSVPAISLGPSRCSRQNRDRRQNRQSWNAHQHFLTGWTS